MEIRNNLSQCLKIYKQARQITFEEFAKELDISKTTLQTYMKGTGNPTVDTWERIEAVIGSDIMGLASAPPNQAQLKAIHALVDMMDALSALSSGKKLQFADWLYNMIVLWVDVE